MKFFVLSILALTSFATDARPVCDADSITREICNHYIQNKELSHLNTSDGGLVPNPFYEPKIGEANQTHYQAGADKDNFSEFVDADLSFQIDAEEILKNSAARNWSAKSRRLAIGSSTVAALLAKAYPSDEQFKIFQGATLYFPENLSDPNSSVKKASQQQAERIIQELGPEVLNQLKTRYLQIPQKILSGGGLNDISVAEHPDLFKRIRKSTPEADKRRQQELTQKAKDYIVEMIKNGRADDQLTDEQKNLIARVTSVTLMDAESQLALANPDCHKKSPNAEYKMIGHSVILCRNLLDLPDASLLRIIAHELGHSIDPCRASCDHMTVDQKKLESLIEISRKEDPSSFPKVKIATDSFRSFGDQPFGLLNGQEEPLRDFLRRKDALTVKQKGIPTNKQPFDSIKKCLIQKTAVDDVSQKDIEIAVYQAQAVSKRLETGETEAHHQKLGETLKRNPDCVHVGGKVSQVSEAMSDVYASYALSRYLKDNPPKSTNDKYAIEGLSPEGLCKPVLLDNKFDVLRKSHPLDGARTKQILFQFPGIAEHFNCDFQKSNDCFQMFDHALGNKSNVSTESGSQR